MKKAVTWIAVITSAVLIIDWGVMGLKLYNNDYDIMAQAVTGLVCFAVILACAVYKVFSDRCPHCGKLRLLNGEYCPYCGKKL